MLEDLPPRARTIPALLARAAQRHRGRPLLELRGVHWRHEDAEAAVSRRAAALLAAGIGPDYFSPAGAGNQAAGCAPAGVCHG